jgi:3-phosphoshikimate 1-carboxyvinyltransferase
MLRLFGIEVHVDGSTICLAGGASLRPPRASLAGVGGPTLISVPADYSSAAFLLIAATLVPGSEVQVTGVCVNPTRTGLSDLLAGMGQCLGAIPRVTDGPTPDNGTGEPVADLLAQACTLTATTAGGDLVVRAIDEFPIFTVAATQASGTTTVRDATELRVKETDRIGAVAQELAKMGARIDERPDGMLIHGPARLHGAVVDCHHDHRMAMALAVAGLVADGETVVQDAGFIDDSFPGFVETMQALGADIRWA